MGIVNRTFAGDAEAGVILRCGGQGSLARENATSHSHPDPEFCLVLAGFSRFIIRGAIHSLVPGTLVWLSADQKHVLVEQSLDHRMLIVSYRSGFVRRCAGPECRRSLLDNRNIVLARKIPSERASLIQKIANELKALPESNRFAKDGFRFLFDMAWRAFCESSEVSEKRETHPAVEKALALLVNGNEEKLSALAGAVGLSASALCRLFKAQVGDSIVRYRNRQRVARFVEYHGRGLKATATEAAYRAGFGSYAQFYRIFTDITGLTPRAYRRQTKG